MITKQRAQEFGIEPQRKSESNLAFRNRVANTLRSMGHIIEAHEAYNNCLYDDPKAATGIMGAVARAVQGREYSGNQIDNDIAAGAVINKPEDELKEQFLLAMIAMME